jgi:type V secretory pathway adhesin AidA
LLIGINNGIVSIDNATVIVADIEATNGVVHVIDAVLVPLTLGLDNVNNSTIGVYPNPVSDLLRFNLGQTSTNASYQVFNQTGALVLSGNFNSTSTSISVEDLQSGLYTVSVLENNKMNSIRFVKK